MTSLKYRTYRGTDQDTSRYRLEDEPSFFDRLFQALVDIMNAPIAKMMESKGVRAAELRLVEQLEAAVIREKTSALNELAESIPGQGKVLYGSVLVLKYRAPDGELLTDIHHLDQDELEFLKSTKGWRSLAPAEILPLLDGRSRRKSCEVDCLLGALSYEARSQLTTIVGNSDALTNGVLAEINDPRAKEALVDICEAAHTLIRRIDRIATKPDELLDRLIRYH